MIREQAHTSCDQHVSAWCCKSRLRNLGLQIAFCMYDQSLNITVTEKVCLQGDAGSVLWPSDVDALLWVRCCAKRLL